jgi:formylglycine-generating enzyme required for sulfatase activity
LRPVEGFKINRYVVTNAWYRLFLEANSKHAAPDGWQERWYPAGQAHWPVTGVSWHDAAAFCRWAGKRLPKPDEWQAAAPQLAREEPLREWVADRDGGGPLVMPGRRPESAESKQADLGFRVAE